MTIFYEKTIAVERSYFPYDRFLYIILNWWTIYNSNKKYKANRTGNAIVNGNSKIDFFENFSKLLEE